MSHLTVRFIGACTHVLGEAFVGVKHRVVVINWSLGQPINGHRIDPHFPRLYVRESDLTGEVPNAPFFRQLSPSPVAGFYCWEMSNVRLTVANPVLSDEYRLGPKFRCGIPNLSGFAPVPLPQLSTITTVIGTSPFTGAFFDIGNGEVDGYASGTGDGRASAAVLNIETGDVPMVTGVATRGGQSVTLNFAPGAEVLVTNIEYAAAPNEHLPDFLINYNVLDVVPPNATWPTTLPECLRDPLEPKRSLDGYAWETVGMGCSNSYYP
ncbi:MAG TPA: hypothetical protein VFN10_09630 [Thermoanaerobaculia bacterium]|nr:hypothetical protein [Thermoanaerobaculia bacterium]